MIDIACSIVDLLVIILKEGRMWTLLIGREIDRSKVWMTFLIIFLGFVQGWDFFVDIFCFVFVVFDILTSYINDSFTFYSDLSMQHLLAIMIYLVLRV